jgi:hypothetical protein
MTSAAQQEILKLESWVFEIECNKRQKMRQTCGVSAAKRFTAAG